MEKPKGGRGHKVPFERKVIKVPVPVEEQVRGLIDDFYDNDYEVPKAAIGLDKAVDEAKQVLSQKKGAKTSVESLLKKLYGVDSVEL